MYLCPLVSKWKSSILCLITLFKAESPCKYCNIVSFKKNPIPKIVWGLVPFTKAAMVVHELKGVLVAGAVAKDSVEHDLKGKHHKMGLHCLRFLQLKERENLGSKTRENLEI